MNTDYSRYEMRAKEKAVFLVAGYIVIFLTCLLFYHSLVLASCAGMVIIFFVPAAERHLCEKRKKLMSGQFRDMLYSLSSSVAAGRQMQEALEDSFRDLSGMYSSDTPLVMELSHIVTGIRENRADEKELLMSLAKRSGIEDIRNFTEVCMACRSTGGDMQHVIAVSGSMLTDKMEIEREIKALTAQKQFEAVIISVMPAACVLMMNIFSPDYLSVMYETFAGRMLMTAALAGIAAAYAASRHVMRIEV